ncbi:MAG: hypothetical protein AABX13_05835 [Nanoarchaeota archaeon]|mgnify:CR=1 FL=1
MPLPPDYNRTEESPLVYEVHQPINQLRQRYLALGIGIGGLVSLLSGGVLGFVLEKYQSAPDLYQDTTIDPTLFSGACGLMLGTSIGAGLGIVMGNRYNRREAERQERENSEMGIP